MHSTETLRAILDTPLTIDTVIQQCSRDNDLDSHFKVKREELFNTVYALTSCLERMLAKSVNRINDIRVTRRKMVSNFYSFSYREWSHEPNRLVKSEQTVLHVGLYLVLFDIIIVFV